MTRVATLIPGAPLLALPFLAVAVAGADWAVLASAGALP